MMENMIEIFRIPGSKFDPFLTHFQGSLRCSMLEIREAQAATVQHSQHFDLNLANSDFKEDVSLWPAWKLCWFHNPGFSNPDELSWFEDGDAD